ncbi:extracellular calcium-sensing receptor-like, partial [Haplochromis burtoni]|uniref:extracellular calcium-sensing receptor-like n=1 Tax=Haplochromis burtoni TaxID=8153 RepID=UPI0003BD4E45
MPTEAQDRSVASSVKCKLQGSTRIPAFSMDGDYVIGGVFSIHYFMQTVNHNYTTMPEPVRCSGSIDTRELRFSRAMVFAIEEINNSTELLPGIRLGYQIFDSCSSVPVAVHVAFQLLNSLDTVFYTGGNCLQSGMVMTIVGESGSTPSISMSRILILAELKKVNFSRNGYGVSFNANGDPVAIYELVNWQTSETGKTELVTVGLYDASLPEGHDFQINRNITWMEDGTQVPVSVCSASCPPGTRKVLQKGKPICCYDCILCPEGETSNTTDSTDCIPCHKEFWPNAKRDTCIPKPVEFLSFQDILGIILAAFSVLGACLAIMTGAVFFHNRKTPIVRANNSELSFLLLISLTLCFLCSLTFIGAP